MRQASARKLPIANCQVTIGNSGALWIGGSRPFDLHEAYLCFRSPAGWQLAARPQRAELLLTTDSRYRLWVNGRHVARGPARCNPHAQSVDRLDVTPYLRAGRNLLAIQVYQPGYSHFAYVYRCSAGVLATLECDGQTALVTDGSWRTRRDQSYSERVPRMSIHQAGVEDRDLLMANAWIAPEYDDSDWLAARVVAQRPAAPWTGLVERRLPLLDEHDLPMALLWVRCGPYPAEVSDVHAALRESWAAGVEISQQTNNSESSGQHGVETRDDGWLEVSLAQGQAARRR